MRLLQKIWLSKYVQKTANLTKRISLPGFNKLPLYDVMAFFIKGMYEGVLGTRASSMAFKFFLALFPGIIFLFTLIPYIPIEGFDQQLFLLLQDVLPDSAYNLAVETIEDIILNKNGSVLSLNFILAMYFATNGVMGMVQEFNNGLNIENRRGFISQQIVSFLLVIVLTFILIISIIGIISTTILSEFLLSQGFFDNESIRSLVEVITWVIMFALIFFAISFIYYFGPSKKDKWRFFSPGASLASILIVISSLGFSYYVNNFAQYNKLYGSIGTLIVIMMWLYINSFVLLIGFELNTSLRSAKNQLNLSSK